MQTFITVTLILNVAIVLLLLYAADKRRKRSYDAFLKKQEESRNIYNAKVNKIKGGK